MVEKSAWEKQLRYTPEAVMLPFSRKGRKHSCSSFPRFAGKISDHAGSPSVKRLRIFFPFPSLARKPNQSPKDFW